MDEDWTIEVSRDDPCSVSFTVEVPAEDVDRERRQVINELKQSVDVPGFRKGKVPDSLIENQFEERVRQGLAQRLVPRVCQTVYEEHDLRPVENPMIEDLQLNGSFRLEASVEVRPRLDVDRDDYVGIPVEASPSESDEDAVEEQLERLRSSQASLEPVPIARPVEEGDFVEIDFQGYDDAGQAVDGTGGDGKVVEVGSGRFLEEIEQGLIGASEGDTRRLEATFPEDFVDDNLAGSTLQFEVTVREIQEERKPELDDEDFLDEMGVESPEALRDTVRERLAEAEEEQSNRERTEQIYEYLLEYYDFPVPDSVLDQETENIVEDYERQVESRGRDFSDFLEQQDISREEMEEDAREEAERRLRLTLIMQAIAEEEDIELEEGEFESRLEAMLDGAMDPGDLDEIPDEQKRSLRHQLRDDKVLEFLIDHADVRETDGEEADEDDDE